jgi:protoheme IX farnesyltransferase
VASPISTVAADQGGVPRLGLRPFLAALKLRIGFEITLTAIAGAAITPGLGVTPWRLAALAFAVLLASCAAGAYNQYAERDIDAQMRRTRHRPFVTGALSANRLWLLVIGLMLVAAAGTAFFATNLAAAVFTVAGALTYGVVYTLWLKRLTWLNIVVGGLAGTFAVLAGAAAVNPRLAAEPALLAIALFFWTPPHFWSLALYNREDYERTRVPMLPALIRPRQSAAIILLHVVAVIVCSLLPAVFGAGLIYLSCAAVGGAYFFYYSVRLWLAPTRANAWSSFKASLVQLTLLLAGAVADGVARGQLLGAS